MTERSGPGVGESHAMWGGRFGRAPDAALAALNNSLLVDRRMWRQDVRASQAWAAALHGAGVVSEQEARLLQEGLDRVADRLDRQSEPHAADEDIHTLVERMLFEEVGEVAGKLHTGRSRNDQVATDLRLWSVSALEAIDEEIARLGTVLVDRAREGVEYVLPGYTHGQPAQPVRWAFVLLAHAWPLATDRDRLREVGVRVSQLPLGSGAVAGSGVNVDRDALKDALGFHSVSPNALHATGDRDFVADMLFLLTMVTTHLSRLSADLLTYNSAEYGFIQLDDAFATGSSLLPQKRNPDVFELARAKSARVLGNLVTMLSAIRGLPAGYSKDLQEDKPQLFDAVDTVLVTLPAVRGAIETFHVRPDRMESSLIDTLLATDLADGLVHRGIPFRRAHELVGRYVREAEQLGVSIRTAPTHVAEAVHEALPAILDEVGSCRDAVDRRVTRGGTSRASVMEQIEVLETVFAGTPVGTVPA